MDFLDQRAESYAVKWTTAEPPALRELSRETNLKSTMPRMLSGHLQGRVLSMLSKLVMPKLVVEVGTFTGYSAICLAEGLSASGKLITMEINDELREMAEKYFAEAGHADKIEMQIGDARELIQKIDGPVDLAFIDADKENYPVYWKLLFPKLRSGGLIIADNVFWSGKVFDPKANTDEETKGLIEFTSLTYAEPAAEQVLLPVRDGLLVIRKK